MGIRCHCPNGHRLNLKTFLAGRRGICPYCGVSFQIPLESSPSASKRAKRPRQPASPDAAGAPSAAPDRASLAGSPVQAPARPAPAAPGPQSAPVSIPPSFPAAPSLSAGAPLPELPSTPTFGGPAGGLGAASGDVVELEPPAPPTTTPDPLAQAANVVWYVRPASGGQFGPATGDVMRTWLQEGRIGPDSLVWREGWRDWQQAADAFPQLNPHGPSLEGLIPATPSPTLPATRSSTYALGRSRSRGAHLGLLIMLLVAVLLLLIVLLLVLRYQSGGHALSGQIVDGLIEA